MGSRPEKVGKDPKISEKRKNKKKGFSSASQGGFVQGDYLGSLGPKEIAEEARGNRWPGIE